MSSMEFRGMEVEDNRQKLHSVLEQYATSEGNVLSDKRKKAPAARQGCQGGEQLIERPWLQLICCAPVFGHEVGRVFRSGESRQDRGPRELSEGVRVDKVGLGPDDVNLQTEELHCNYSVLIGSLEQEESSLLCYPTIINIRRIIRRNKLYNYHISGI